MATEIRIELTDDSQQKFIIELLSKFDFVKLKAPIKAISKKRSAEDIDLEAKLRRSVQAMKDDLSGKKPLPSLREVLDGL
ncbi:MAG: hypothetical protein IPI00_19065 [Flavobacteriales bacterium]|nr:hypothetical protein [Flavobacteriales bacterium]MBK6943107.1 hypothetical protein [Flavobacteriales bacterium]MBK7242197.1 hypothetical protein [Flavobacteriales bacterium]MBK7298909.1 hypothetical protein [Flavobacteriales bacterium]MBK9534587.1 hypothetical protein [Flavobacteriales bacterium]